MGQSKKKWDNENYYHTNWIQWTFGKGLTTSNEKYIEMNVLFLRDKTEHDKNVWKKRK